MKRILLLLSCVILVAVPVSAQEGRPRGQRGQQRAQMQRMVMERFMTNFVQSAGLDESEREQLGDAMQGFFEARREHGMAERQVWMALEEQLRPGVGADADSLNALLGSLFAMQTEAGSVMKNHDAVLSEFLSPVQRSLFLISWQRFQRQTDAIRNRRGDGPPRGGGENPF